MIRPFRRPLRKPIRKALRWRSRRQQIAGAVLRSAQSLSPEWPVGLLWPFVQRAFFWAAAQTTRRFRQIGSLAHQARKIGGR